MFGVVGALQRLGVPVPATWVGEHKEERRTGFWTLFSRFQIRAEEVETQQYKGSGRPEKVLVAGGSGFVGSEVCLQLRKAGYEVIIISRSPGQFRMTWGEFSEHGLPSGTKAVVNLAGQNVLDPFSRWSPVFKELCRSSRLETTKQLAGAIRRAPEGSKPGVFVSMSGVGYYPTNSGAEYNEGGVQGSDWLAELSGEWEAAATASGVRTVILRPGVVLGRNGGMIQQIYLPFFLGLGGRMGSGSQDLAWVHVKDLAGLVQHAVQEESMEGVYNAVAPQVISNQEFVNAFSGALGRPAFIPLPEFVWNFVFGEERAAMITKGQKVLPTRTLESGYKFRFPSIKDACAEIAPFPYLDADLAVTAS